MSLRIVILSDLHMGRPRGSVQSAEAVRPLWQDASHLVINGDLAELHHPEYRAEAARQAMRFFELCEEDNVALTLLSGNHDAQISDVRHLLLSQGRVLITHGDVLHPAIVPWSINADLLREEFAKARKTLAAETRDGMEQRLEAAQHAALAEWDHGEHHGGIGLWQFLRKPWLGFVLLHYWATLPARARRFMREHAPQAEYFILGHTHRHGIWQRGGHTVINTGCFGFPGRPLAVVIEGNFLTVWKIRQRAGLYRFARGPMRVFDLPTNAIAAEFPRAASPIQLDAQFAGPPSLLPAAAEARSHRA